MYINKIKYRRIAEICFSIGTTLLLGCTSIPTMVPDMAIMRSHPTQLEGTHGPLTFQQSKDIITKIKKNGEKTNIFDRHLALETEIVGIPLVVGNKVELLVDGPMTYDSMFAAIENAKDHVNMETFIIENDEIGQRFSKELIRKQNAGIQVNLIYDSVGSLNTPRDFFKTLTDSGINVLEYNPINPLIVRKDWQVNQRDHRKLLIIDGKTAFVGGINISSVYSNGSFGQSNKTKNEQPWRDTHLRIDGPVVSDFQNIFMETWGKQNGKPLAAKNYFPKLSYKGKEVVRAIGSSPKEPYSQIYVTLISAINSAETNIFITNAYFIPDEKLISALSQAVKRGVEVRLLLPDKTDSTMVFHASRSYYDELLTAGIEIYEREDALLHAKTAVIDGVWSTIGSTNLDWRSFTNNQEINAVVLGQSFGTQMQTMFENDLVLSKRITLEFWRGRSFGARIKESAARIWARLL